MSVSPSRKAGLAVDSAWIRSERQHGTRQRVKSDAKVRIALIP